MCLIQLSGQSQQCLPDGIIFNTQAQIDSFPMNYPNCNQIQGYVLVAGYDISNFDSLINVNTIDGDLSINGGPFGGNPLLTILSGLDSLTYIGGNLNIEFNQNLTSLNGLENLNIIGGDLRITKNNSITNLTGLNNLNSVGDDFEIWGNNAMVNLSGLENLTSIGGNFRLSGWMANILFGNPALNSLAALGNLSSINGDIDIQKNNVLSSLNGLENIEANSISNIYIYENQSLSTCDVNSICDFLANENGIVEIYDNNTGCNSQEEVEYACSVEISEINNESEFIIYPNPVRNELFISNKKGILISEAEIYNQLGQKVLHSKFKNNKLDISNLEEGIYFIEFLSNNSKIRKKLIVGK